VAAARARPGAALVVRQVVGFAPVARLVGLADLPARGLAGSSFRPWLAPSQDRARPPPARRQ